MIRLSALRTRPANRPTVWRTPPWLRRAFAAACLVCCLGSLSLGALGVADLNDAPARYTTFPTRVAWVLESGNRLHYSVHIVAGRLLDVCPCTRAAADRQYWRARYHAVTPLQWRVVLAPYPRTPVDWLEFMAGPLQVGQAWLGDAASWASELISGP